LALVGGCWLWIGCAGDPPSKNAAAFVGTWQAPAETAQMRCNGVETTRPIAPSSLRFQAGVSTDLDLIALGATGAAASPCVYAYVITGDTASLDGKQTCTVVTDTATTTTAWLDDVFTLTGDDLTLDEIGTFSDSVGCATSVTIRYAREM
jgi:hypothetical protein